MFPSLVVFTIYAAGKGEVVLTSEKYPRSPAATPPESSKKY